MSDLWTYALRLYDQPQVKDACLKLQNDAGADVCLLLLSCWSSSEKPGLWPTELCTELSKISREFQQDLLAPLRSARDHLKVESQAGVGWAHEVRAEILKCELKIERELLRRYEEIIVRHYELEALENITQKALHDWAVENFVSSSAALKSPLDENAMKQLMLVTEAATRFSKR